jgi:hypothetical protein
MRCVVVVVVVACGGGGVWWCVCVYMYVCVCVCVWGGGVKTLLMGMAMTHFEQIGAHGRSTNRPADFVLREEHSDDKSTITAAEMRLIGEAFRKEGLSDVLLAKFLQSGTSKNGVIPGVTSDG